METLKTAVIGAGNMGKNHVRVYSLLKNSELVGISDVDIERAKALSEQYGGNAYKDYIEMIKKERPDAVSVVVPTALHAKIGCDVLEYTNALVEKPIALTIKEANQLVKTSEKNDRKLMVGQIERFDPVIQKLIEYAPKEEYLTFSIMRLGPYVPKLRTTGVIIDLGIHDIDLVRYLTGEEPEQVHATCRHITVEDVEDHAHVFLKMPSSTASLVTNWISPVKIRHMYATFRDVFLYINFIEQTIQIYKKEDRETVKQETLDVEKEEPLKIELNAFLDCIAHDKPSPVSGEDATKSLEIALRATRIAYESDPNLI